jgi:UDP-GlcNAc:undecaprenyl-phosphate/decaprenyl-phosphate GlcNAc-1-phosphate transferase
VSSSTLAISVLSACLGMAQPQAQVPGFSVPPPPPPLPMEVIAPNLGAQVQQLTAQNEQITKRLDELSAAVGVTPASDAVSRIDVFHGYIGVFLAAFMVALLVTPLMRRLAIANNIVDRPDETRKHHKFPVAYLGGVAVYLGIMAGVLFSYMQPMHGLLSFHPTKFLDPEGMITRVPISIVAGLTIIMLIGLMDDVMDISPWQKVGGQLFAAALIAMEDVGVKVALQILAPIGQWLGNPNLLFHIPLPVPLPMFGDQIPIDLVYWTGTGIIAVFILGACNASNLIDGLDGACSGVTAIAAFGLLIVSLGLAAGDAGRLDAARIILCMSLMGACLGFLPHNFNPAVIFLGDCGSLMLGFATIVIVLTLGDMGRTDLVIAGLIIYSIPILDTVLAIIRRKLAGKSIADADDNHLHHMFKRALGVKGAAFAIYALGLLFAGIGVWLATSKARVTYALAMVAFSFIAIMAIKVARRKAFEEQMMAKYGGSTTRAPGSAPAVSDGPGGIGAAPLKEAASVPMAKA